MSREGEKRDLQFPKFNRKGQSIGEMRKQGRFKLLSRRGEGRRPWVPGRGSAFTVVRRGGGAGGGG